MDNKTVFLTFHQLFGNYQFFLTLCNSDFCVSFCFLGGPNQMIVTWNTYSPVKESIVEYGIDQMNFQASGSSRILVNAKEGPPFIAIQYVHKVVLSGLTPGTKYSKYVSSF